MNPPAALLVLTAVGGILIAGTAAAIFASPPKTDGAVKIAYEADAAPPQSVPEPLFPGMPAR